MPSAGKSADRSHSPGMRRGVHWQRVMSSGLLGNRTKVLFQSICIYAGLKTGVNGRVPVWALALSIFFSIPALPAAGKLAGDQEKRTGNNRLKDLPALPPQ